MQSTVVGNDGKPIEYSPSSKTNRSMGWVDLQRRNSRRFSVTSSCSTDGTLSLDRRPSRPELPVLRRGSMSSSTWFEDAVAVEDIGPPCEVAMAEATAERVSSFRRRSLTAPLSEEASKLEEAKGKTNETLPREALVPEILPDVKPFSEDAKTNLALASLLNQSKQLSEDCFHANCLEGCSKRGGWKITLLADGVEDGVDAVLLGFLVYRLARQNGALSVAKIAVPEIHRRCGYGKVLIDWAVQIAKKDPDMRCICLSALPAAVKFYQRIGFKKIDSITQKTGDDIDDEYEPGQVYMEKETKGGRAGKKKKRN